MQLQLSQFNQPVTSSTHRSLTVASQKHLLHIYMDHHVIQLARSHPPPQQQRAAGSASADHEQPKAAAADGQLEMCPSLYRAARSGRVKEVMALVLQPRHGHARAGHRQVDGIIQHGQCDLLEVTADRNTVLHIAAKNGDSELIQELYHRFIKDSDFLSRRNSALDTPLHCAARAGHAGVVTTLIHLAQECEENILGYQNAAGDTALHLAARHAHGAAVEALVAARATAASELNKAGVSPLYLAVMSRSVPAVRAIITSCQDASSVGPSLQNALHAAVFQSSDMVDLLLQWKPELASQVDCNGSTPLHFAASSGNRSVVSAILRVVPPSTVYMKDTDGLSALHVAGRLGHAGVVEKIIKEFPDAEELRDGHGGTFLHVAAREKHSSVVSLAIKNSKKNDLLNTQDEHGNTPLHLAVVAGAPGIVDALLRKGKVQTDVLNDDGLTPLDLASTSTSLFNMLSSVVILVAFGAQPRPQRHDHLKPWRGKDITKRIEKMSDSLVVVATLIASVAFAAGFNMPGGYGDNDGTANLKSKAPFKWFLVLDALAVAASVVAVILLVYGKVSRSDSWKSFTIALNFMWASLFSLVLAFYSAFRAVMTTSRALSIVFLLIYIGLLILVFFVGQWIKLSPKICTVWRFVRVWRSRHHAHAVKRAYPFAGTPAYSYLFILLVTFITFAGLGVVGCYELNKLLSWRSDNTISPASAPM